MSTTDVLLEAYDRLHRLGPEYGGDEEGNHGNTNHGPMAAEVMVRRGLDIDVTRWLDRYVTRLAELPTPRRRFDAGAWREALGDPARLADWHDYFREELRQESWRAVLATWWPRLLPGIAAGSTHGVIRVGHAVRALLVTDHPHALVELAHGLAFWAARWRPIAAAGVGDGYLTPAQALENLPQLPDQTGFIAHRLERLDRYRSWPAAVNAVSLPTEPDDVPDTLAGLVDAATLRYLRVGAHSPVLLVHSATAPNAVLHCLPALPRGLWRRSLEAVWTAVAALTVMYAGPASDRLARRVHGEDLPANLLDRVAGHCDEHVIKFTDTALDAYTRTGDRDTLAAAHLAADLIPTPS